jgi:uncharacterized protein (TIGR00255 family)
MIKSMTGYGRGEAEAPTQKWIVELRTLNHRFLDLSLNLPKHLWALEARFRKGIKAVLVRGRVEMQLTWETKPESAFSLKLDPELVAGTGKMLAQLTALAGLDETARLDHFLRFADFFTSREREAPALEEAWEYLSPALIQALEVVEQMRLAEGAALAGEMQAYVAQMRQSLGLIKAQAETLPRMWQEKIKTRLEEVLAETGGVDETRLVQEVAFLAERRDINEEMARLDSHMTQFHEILLDHQMQGPVGRKLEFLLQEMLREINTIGSKANDLSISQAVVDMKGHLERLREQVQNIE